MNSRQEMFLTLLIGLCFLIGQFSGIRQFSSLAFALFIVLLGRVFVQSFAWLLNDR